MIKLFKKKGRLNIDSARKENDTYSDWSKVIVKFSDGKKEFNIQKYLSSDDIEKIISEYGKFMVNKSEEISSLSRDDESKLKIIMGILYCFLIRYKTDIMSNKVKTVCGEINDEQMLLASLDIINLNIFSKILESFDKSSLELLRERFDVILEGVPAVAKNKECIDLIKKSKNG